MPGVLRKSFSAERGVWQPMLYRQKMLPMVFFLSPTTEDTEYPEVILSKNASGHFSTFISVLSVLSVVIFFLSLTTEDTEHTEAILKARMPPGALNLFPLCLCALRALCGWIPLLSFSQHGEHKAHRGNARLIRGATSLSFRPLSPCSLCAFVRV